MAVPIVAGPYMLSKGDTYRPTGGVSLLGGLCFRLAVCRVALIRYIGPRIFRHIGIGNLTPWYLSTRRR